MLLDCWFVIFVLIVWFAVLFVDCGYWLVVWCNVLCFGLLFGFWDVGLLVRFGVLLVLIVGALLICCWFGGDYCLVWRVAWSWCFGWFGCLCYLVVLLRLLGWLHIGGWIVVFWC